MSSTPVSARKGVKLLVILAASIAIAAGVVFFAIPSTRADDSVPEALLPKSTHMGVVELNVHDLGLVRDYYVDAVGLKVLDEADDSVTLGYSDPLLNLTTGAGEPGATMSEAGLYHSAILYPDAASLASVIYNLGMTAPESFQGSADHAVSHAFYFVDPEGNGLELYVDTPESEWRWVDGEVQMGSAPLDPNAFIQEHLGADAAADVTDANMGHVHLKVGALDTAEAFYAELLGFAVTARSDGALFYAAGGYHHHLATNTWQSPGAGARTNETGLGSLSVVLPSDADIQEIVDRLDAAGHEYESIDGGVVTADPWGNTVLLTT